MDVPPAAPSPRPLDATLTVTKAAKVLGVHPNTVRAWSDQGRLRYYRINDRGDRRYRPADLQRFLTAAENGPDPAIVALPNGLRAGPARGRIVRPVALPRAPGSRSPGDELLLLAELAELARRSDPSDTLDVVLAAAVQRIRAVVDAALVGIWQHAGERLVLRASSGDAPQPRLELPTGFGILGEALAHGIAVRVGGGDDGPLPVAGLGGWELARAINADRDPWGVLLVAGRDGEILRPADRALAGAIARVLAALVAATEQREDAARRIHRAEAIGRVAGDIGSRLEFREVLGDVADHALTMFRADRAATLVRRADGSFDTAGRNLSEAFLALPRDVAGSTLAADAVAARAPRFATGSARDPRTAAMRAALVQEGIDTIAVAPMLHGDELVGLLEVLHDRPHAWQPDELETLAALAAQSATAIRTARNYDRMATWTAQLQSIQQLGARLSRLGSVTEIAHAIANELRQLIEYHNVRVYRLHGEDLVPVAMLGQVGEYTDETPEQLFAKLGQGITGWVAEHRVAQNLPDAANDPRCMTIAGTEDDLDESMLLAPMLHEDQCLGVLVLSKLGLNQFTDDDLRLLVIYASFAAQAIANADATERLRLQSEALERQLRAQRELLRVTESILTSLDTREVLERITERLGSLVTCDNIAIEVVDRASGLLVPLTARGIHADEYLQPWEPGETGIATWVVEHNEPALIADERADPRVNHFGSAADADGSLIVVPLLGPDGAVGVLTLERLGAEQRFGEDEFELVKLFAAQVSIALRNAEVHRAVEIRARTDDLTGLLNHGTFQDRLRLLLAGGDPFSLVMIDLDAFKVVNDDLGHQAGDRLLREIGQVLVSAARESDLVFRYGGDEFALLLPRTDGSHAVTVAERVRDAIAGVGDADSPWRQRGLEVSASVGVASAPEDGSTADDVLLAADRACFVAKRSGRGLVATAAEGLAQARGFTLSEPTPVDPPSVSVA